MKRTYFIRHDQRIRRAIGCDRATLILDRLEFYSSKQPDGFYKFIEPNSHRLYKKDDSWTELLNCHRTSFWRAFKLIGKKHTSRWTFEESEDKFEGKLYASYYDRNTNRMFFIRNHDAVKEFLAKIQPRSELVDTSKKSKDNSQSCPGFNQTKNPLRTEQTAHLYIESKKTSLDLSKDKSHAEEIIKKMIEIWTAIVQEGRGQVELEGNIIPFLKKAFKDKFNSCLQKWKDYCTSIACSKFLMGEKTSWKADLEWALKFESIRKVLSGNYYGIGDRIPKTMLPSQADFQEEILASAETQEIKDFRTLSLETVGKASYISHFKELSIEFREEGEIVLNSPHKFAADLLERTCYSYLRLVLQRLGEKSARIIILAPGETKGRLIERERGGGAEFALPTVSTIEQPISENLSMEKIDSEDELLPEVSLETKALQEKLKVTIPPHQFPSWMNSVEVENIGKNGVLVITLADSFAVNYCQLRFSQEILRSAKILWDGVTSLVIREKESCPGLPAIGKSPQKPETTKEKSRFDQAIQSLLSVCSPNFTGIRETQGACPAFG